MKPLLLSLRPRFADLVFSGRKTVELRRRIAAGCENRQVFVYVSGDKMALCGGFRVGRVWHAPPQKIWQIVLDDACVNKAEFDEYYLGLDTGYALEVKDVWRFDSPIELESLRIQFENFVVPQSWRYVRNEELQVFQMFRRTNTAVQSGIEV